MQLPSQQLTATNALLLPNDLVDASTAGRILQLSKWTIYQWIERGYIPHYRLGRLIRIRKADLAAKLEQERRSGSVPQNFIAET